MSLVKYIAKLHAHLERKANAKSFWQGIEFQKEQAEQLEAWSKTDNYGRIVKE